MQIDKGIRNTIDLFTHKSNFDVLKRIKEEKVKVTKYEKRRKDLKKPPSKIRGEEKFKNKEKERSRVRREIRKRKMAERNMTGGDSEA